MFQEYFKINNIPIKINIITIYLKTVHYISILDPRLHIRMKKKIGFSEDVTVTLHIMDSFFGDE